MSWCQRHIVQNLEIVLSWHIYKRILNMQVKNEILFARWCRSQEILEDFEKLRQLILIEEF